MKDQLCEQIGVLLLRRGFSVKCLPRRWFDIIGRRNSTVLFIKVLHDANSISPELAQEMRQLAGFIGGSPLIVAEKAGEQRVDDGVVHSRFGVYTVNVQTFSDCLAGRLPLIMRSQAGATVSVVGSQLSKSMDSRGYSLSEVSRRMGVSRQMVARYRVSRSQVSVRKAEIMHSIFGGEVFERVDILSGKADEQRPGESQVARKYEALGFRAIDTRKAPFDIVAKLEKEIILTGVGDKADQSLASLTHLIGADNLIIYEHKKPGDKDIPAIKKAEFLDMQTARELISFLREF